ncbi:hypothetical protein NDU88_011400 [Pleurodeles waltl]|uniref:Uncharacterized protein n=1 Tax=Pleurodeles waltl TaxID=8319 RepID=A0AAV7Q0J0_PLEWA|nr:hypothetical protein NDU88_011400 [Pleurodeles waltl]
MLRVLCGWYQAVPVLMEPPAHVPEYAASTVWLVPGCASTDGASSACAAVCCEYCVVGQRLCRVGWRLATDAARGSLRAVVLIAGVRCGWSWGAVVCRWDCSQDLGQSPRCSPTNRAGGECIACSQVSTLTSASGASSDCLKLRVPRCGALGRRGALAATSHLTCSLPRGY